MHNLFFTFTTMTFNLVLLMAMVATNILFLYHLSSTLQSPKQLSSVLTNSFTSSTSYTPPSTTSRASRTPTTQSKNPPFLFIFSYLPFSSSSTFLFPFIPSHHHCLSTTHATTQHCHLLHEGLRISNHIMCPVAITKPPQWIPTSHNGDAKFERSQSCTSRHYEATTTDPNISNSQGGGGGMKLKRSHAQLCVHRSVHRSMKNVMVVG